MQGREGVEQRHKQGVGGSEPMGCVEDSVTNRETLAHGLALIDSRRELNFELFSNLNQLTQHNTHR